MAMRDRREPSSDPVARNDETAKEDSMSATAENAAVPPSPGETDHFETGHLLAGLKGRAISSGVVTVAGQAAQVGLNLFSIMVLARLLLPEDFGLVAMVATVMGFLRIFNDAGLSLATVQR